MPGPEGYFHEGEGIICFYVEETCFAVYPLRSSDRTASIFLVCPMGIRQADPKLLCDGGYTGVGVVDDDSSDINLAGTYAENRFAVEKLVNVDDANLFSSGIVSIARIIGYLDAKRLSLPA